MDLFLDLIVSLSGWCRSHLSDIALAIVACLLVLFGPGINNWIRYSTASMNFVLRTLIFVLVCAVGYGLVIVYASPWLAKALGQLNNYTLSPILILVFCVIGVIADRR